MKFHLFVGLFSLSSYFFWTSLSDNFRTSFFLLSLVAFIRFVKEFFKHGSQQLIITAKEAEDMSKNYQILPSKSGVYTHKIDNFPPTLTEYIEVHLTLENGDKYHGLCPSHVFNGIKTGTKVKIYTHDIFIVKVENFIEE